MDSLPKLLFGVAVATLIAGCNPFAESLKKNVKEEGERNRTLTTAAVVMKSVMAWSASHGGALPSPVQFRDEVKVPIPSLNGFNLTESDLLAAQQAFEWRFPGGKPTDPKAVVGRLPGPDGAAVAYADGEVKREDLLPAAGSGSR